MALRYAVLAALLDGEASAYDLAKGFDASVANFWMATPPQVYRELDRMQADGLIQSRTVEQQRRPTKRLFSLTPAGQEALRRFTTEPSKPGPTREELLVKIHAIDTGDAEAIQTALTQRLGWSRAKLARYDRLHDRLLNGRGEADFLAQTDRIGPYLTLLRGRVFEEETIRWIEKTLEILRHRERPAEQ